MTRKEQIELIFEVVNEDFLTLEKIYFDSIKSKTLDKRIYIRVKNLLENLRTAYDFVAWDIIEKNKIEMQRAFFPIHKKTTDINKIKISLNGAFPGLENVNATLYNYLLQIQPALTDENTWLELFNDICGSNKHEMLSLQVRQDDIVNVLTYKNGKTLMWTDGLVDFNTEDKEFPIRIFGGGTFGMTARSELTIQDGYLTMFGWIVHELQNYQQRTKPDLAKVTDYSLTSYLIGNFYFENSKSDVYSTIKQFIDNSDRLIRELYKIV